MRTEGLGVWLSAVVVAMGETLGLARTQDSKRGGRARLHPSLCSPQRPNHGSHQFSLTDHQTIKILPYWKDSLPWIISDNLPNVLACPRQGLCVSQHGRQPQGSSKTMASVCSDSLLLLQSHLILPPITPKFTANPA